MTNRNRQREIERAEDYLRDALEAAADIGRRDFGDGLPLDDEAFDNEDMYAAYNNAFIRRRNQVEAEKLRAKFLESEDSD